MEVYSLNTDWISLFNDENLNGWKAKNSEKDNGKIKDYTFQSPKNGYKINNSYYPVYK